MNILFMVSDALRPDRLHCYGNSFETSPTLDRLAAEGVLFANAFANCNHTIPGLVSEFTGTYSVSHGINKQERFRDWAKLWREWQTPFRVLRDKGYAVAGPDPRIYSPLGYDRGSRDVADMIRRYMTGDSLVWNRSEHTHLPYNPSPPYDTAFWPEGFEVSDSLRERLEVVKSYLIVHRPGLVSRLEAGAAEAIEVAGYERSAGVATFSPDERPAILALYDGCVRMFDDEIEGCIDRLAAMGALDDTLIVITSDHGEQLLERGAIGHSSCALEGNLYDENIRIPLILWRPGSLSGGVRVERQVSQVDIMPTLFDLLGFEMPGPVEGRSLLPLIRGEAPDWDEEIYAETTVCGWQALDDDHRQLWCIRRPPWKLIKNEDPPRPERYELFHLENDPDEKHNLYDREPTMAKELKGKLEAWSQKMNLQRLSMP